MWVCIDAVIHCENVGVCVRCVHCVYVWVGVCCVDVHCVGVHCVAVYHVAMTVDVHSSSQSVYTVQL